MALFIAQQFRDLAVSAKSLSGDDLGLERIKHSISEFRNALIKERQELIRQEIELYSLV